ncbi:SMI1/KNR4 family protein [Undibacterium danionis]|uniref:SMI1/KNR4 family protein n=1 Tax=Undibacterium danionis TaxID=1812100 RepID=A0ABV6I8R5_9BURK
MNWNTIFTDSAERPGASEIELRDLLRTLFAPLSFDEISATRKQASHNPFNENDLLHVSFRTFDPKLWTLPTFEIPVSLLEFLRFSNGGDFSNEDRHFQFFPALHPTNGLRAMLLAYEFPEYMPMGLPFAFNGGGTFYIFDMRGHSSTGDYPIVASHASSLGWDSDECWFVANSLEEACRGKTNIDDLRKNV